MVDRFTGVVGTLSVVVLTGIGIWALFQNYAFSSPDESLLWPTVLTLGVTTGFVFVLFALGARSDRWLANPYW